MKLNLTIDASGIFYRSLFTIGNYGIKKGQKLLETEESKGIFMRKLATDFAALVKSVDNLSRVIVALDSSSWRKKIPIEHGGYKISREDKDTSTVDWDAFFKLTQEFTDILATKGYLMSRIKNAEADDLLFLWKRKLNEMGECVILVTGDRDLLQTIGLHPNGSWTVALDPISQRRKVSLTQATYDSCKNDTSAEIDLFNPDSWTSAPGDVLFSLLSKNDTQIIDPAKVAYMKVLLGDNGDSVPGVISWLDKNKHGEEVERSLTENKMLKALVNVPPMTWEDLRSGNNIELLAKELSVVSKIETTPEQLQAKIDRNIKLVVLDESIIPQDIQDNFSILFEEVASSPTHLTRDAILEGTKWWTTVKQVYVPKGYDFNIDGQTDDINIFAEDKIQSNTEENEILQKAINDIRSKNETKKGSNALF